MNRILLAEDEKWVRVALRKTIEKTGLPFEVAHEATNGLEASDWLKQHTVDMVMTDIRMPIMDGLALLEHIRGSGIASDLVVVSGHDDFQCAQRAVRLGAFDYMLKPVETCMMKECLQRWLDVRRNRSEEGKAASSAGPIDDRTMSPVEIVTRRIASRPEANMTLSEAASLVHLNPSYLCKLFKQQTGVNFTDYVITTRMQEAARLLEKTALRVTEIADRLGYADLAYFSNTFKKTIGVTPSDYRKRMPEMRGRGGA